MTAFRLRRAGFTVIETMVSAAVLSLIVFAAVTASQTAMRATSGVVSEDSADGRARHVVDRLRAMFLSASAGSLEGIPSAGGYLAEPMQSAVTYNDVRFRTVTGYAKGAPVFVPPLGTPPFRIYRAVDKTQRGSLVLDNGTETQLISDVDRLTFQREGKRLLILLTTSPEGVAEPVTVDVELVMLVP